MNGHDGSRALDDTSAPAGFRGDPADRALVTLLAMRLSIAEQHVAELSDSAHASDEARAVTSALAVATWRASRPTRRWRCRVEQILGRVRGRAGADWSLLSRRELRDALTTLDLFDAEAYAAAVPQAIAGTTPLQHFLDHGYAARQDPGPGFRVAAYLAANGDVAAAGVNPLGHYLAHGWRECRPGVGRIALRTAAR